MVRTTTSTMILHAFFVSLLIGLAEQNDLLMPTLHVSIAVHPDNKLHILPFTLSALQNQTYHKDRMDIHFRTERHSFDAPYSDNERRNNEKTITMLTQWIRRWQSEYHDLRIDIGTDLVGVDPQYWTESRFKLVIAHKENAIRTARETWADFLLLLDADVILSERNALADLIVQNSNQVVFAPMLSSLGTYSNFWAGISDLGYYKRADNYLPLLNRETIGRFQVPMIHSAIFVNMNHKESRHVTFSPSKLSSDYGLEMQLDDMIALAKWSNLSGIPLILDNSQPWGYFPPAIDSDTDWVVASQQDLVDIQLDAIADGNPLHVSPDFDQTASFYEKDSLGVDKIYVINLKRRPERRERMRHALEILGVSNVTYWEAVDGKESLNPETLYAMGIKPLPGYSDPHLGRGLTRGEIGCFLSHFQIWNDILAADIDRAIVLEDDVRFDRNFRDRWSSALKEVDSLAPDADFLYLGRKILARSREKLIGEHLARPGYSYWTIGYMITRHGARKLVASQPLAKMLPVDEFLPIMFGEHPNVEWSRHFPTGRGLVAYSVNPLLISPSHFVGDEEYTSDTEDSPSLANQVPLGGADGGSAKRSENPLSHVHHKNHEEF